MRASTAIDRIQDLELEGQKREDEIAGLRRDVARLEGRLLERGEEVAHLKPLEGTVAALGAEIDALKMQVRGAAGVRRIERMRAASTRACKAA